MSQRGPTEISPTTGPTATNQRADGSEPAPRTRLRASGS